MKSQTATKPTISLVMIVKNEEANLPVVLASAKEFVDEIVIVDTGSTDKTKEVAASFGAKVYDFSWCDDFAAARNFSFSKATSDWILWLDADDALVAGDKMAEFVAATPPTVGGVMAQYFYAFDEDGNCVAVHKKVRLCRNNGTFTWKGKIHEDLVPVGATEVHETDLFSVKHLAELPRMMKSSERNLEVALKAYAEDKKDPRVVFNLANAHLSLGHHEEAIRKFMEYIPMSGWDEEIYMAWCRIAHSLIKLEQLDEASNMYLRAVKVKPRYAEAFRGLAHIAIYKGNLEDAEEYFKMVLMKEKPKSSIVWNPFEYEVVPFYELAQVYMYLGRVDEAIEANTLYLSRSNNKKNGLELQEKLLVLKEDEKFRNDYIEKAKAVDEEGDKEKIKTFLDSIPADNASDPVLVRLRNKYFKKTESSGKDVVFFCGRAFEDWGPHSLEKGIGGSEEATIRLSREFARRGWYVTVYNNCGVVPIIDELAGGVGAVVYRPFWEFNPEDKNDVFISWRNPIAFDMKINAKVKLLDLHDVISPMDYPTKRLAEITKIMVKSQFHRRFLPHIPDDKFAVIGHGVDADEYLDQNAGRDRHQVVYTSSYDRGLENLLTIWPEVIKEIPDAKLKIVYGWDLFDKMRTSKVDLAWKEKMVELMKQPGVSELGRVSHQEVAKLMMSSGVFAYPCHFEEIYCIAAAKAQMAGCVPVVGISNNCLDETVKIGVHIRGDMKSPEGREMFSKELIKILKDEELQREVGVKAREKAMAELDWGKVAEEWIKHFTV